MVNLFSLVFVLYAIFNTAKISREWCIYAKYCINNDDDDDDGSGDGYKGAPMSVHFKCVQNEFKENIYFK